MAEDRSLNDPSSDASERSGFTSLASSAHAMRIQAVSGLRTLFGHPRASGDSGDSGFPGAAPGSSGALRSETHLCTSHVTSDGVEKRARFSQSVLSDAHCESGKLTLPAGFYHNIRHVSYILRLLVFCTLLLSFHLNYPLRTHIILIYTNHYSH